MRAGIGLLSILIVACIIFWVMFGSSGGGRQGYVPTVLKAGDEGRKQAQEISGRTEDNVPIDQTIKMDEVDAGGEFRRLRVVSIVAGTPMETCYGLKVNDEITRVGDMGVRDNNNPDLAKALVCEAYSRSQPLVIERNGQEITLTPKTALSDMHPNLFGKPGAVVNPNSTSSPSAVPGLPKISVPSN